MKKIKTQASLIRSLNKRLKSIDLYDPSFPLKRGVGLLVSPLLDLPFSSGALVSEETFEAVFIKARIGPSAPIACVVLLENFNQFAFKSVSFRNSLYEIAYYQIRKLFKVTSSYEELLTHPHPELRKIAREWYDDDFKYGRQKGEAY